MRKLAQYFVLVLLIGSFVVAADKPNVIVIFTDDPVISLDVGATAVVLNVLEGPWFDRYLPEE